jgi:hypothetical protein
MYHLKKQSARRAATAVEFAIILPVVVVLLLGAMELGRGVMVQHMLQEAAQAGCRLYCVSDEDLTQQESIDIIELAMERAGIDNYQVVFDPPTKAEIDEHMEPVTVTITASYGDVAWFTPAYLTDAAITGACSFPADLYSSDGDDGDTSKKQSSKSKKDPKKVSKKVSKKDAKKTAKKTAKKAKK